MIDSTSFQRQSDEFIHWLAGKPGVRISSKIQVADLRLIDAGRGVVARSDISEGEELFTIPRDIILTPENSKLKDFISEDLKELDQWMSLIVVMIYEYLLGQQSMWAAYFNILPKEFDTLMFWGPSELQELKGSAILDKIGKQNAEESVLKVIVPLVRANPSLFPPTNGLTSYNSDAGAQVLIGLSHMMGSLIMAYAFDVDNTESEDGEGSSHDGGYMTDEEEQSPKGMIPLADLLNADADCNNAQLFQEGGVFIMKAVKPIRKGNEIFNDYGEIPRAELLRRYGYVTDNYSPYDVVELSLTDICYAAGLESDHVESQPPLQYLDDLELLEDGYVIPRPSVSDLLSSTLPDELILLLKTLTLSRQQLELQRSKGKPPKLSIGKEEAVLIDMAVRQKLSRYSTTIQQDQELLTRLNEPGASVTRRQRMAIQVRIGEKEILHLLQTMIYGFLSGDRGLIAKRRANDDGGEPTKAKSLKS